MIKDYKCVLMICFYIVIYILSSSALLHAEIEDGKQESSELKIEEVEKVLEFLAIQLKANSASIKTWQASYRFSDTFRFNAPLVVNKERKKEKISGSAYLETVQGEVKFWLDKQADKLKVFYDVTENPEFLVLDTDKLYSQDKSSLSSKWIVTPEHFLELDEKNITYISGIPNSESAVLGVGPGRVLFRKSTEEAYSNGRFFDPRRILFGDGYDDFASACEIYAKALAGAFGDEKKEKIQKLVSIVKAKDDLGNIIYSVTYKFKAWNNSTLTNQSTIVFDSSFDYQPTKFTYNSSGKPTHTRTYAYKKFGDTFIPIFATIKKFDLNNPDELNSKRIFKLIDSKLNIPIPSDTFELESLKLKHGERMYDTLNKKLFVQSGAKKVSPKDFAAMAQQEIQRKNANRKITENNSNRYVLVLVVNMIFLLIIIFVYWLKRKKRMD